jgi:hypothetical protein
MSANYNVLVDEDNDFSDWIELYNNSDIPANLSGYYLSDDKINLQKWEFPPCELAPKAYMIVFASGKDKKNLPYSWQTIINRGDTWQYRIPTTDLGTAWHSALFDDSGWQQGASGFGYGDNDDATILPSCVSVFIRKKFEIVDLSKVRKLVLHMDFDDGFVAYINGTEIARSNLGTPGNPVAYNTLASDKEANIYRGLAPDIYEIHNPQSLLVQGTNVITIQGHNASANSSDLTLIPFLTLATEETTQINNVHAYFTPPTNYLHTNFKLDRTGEVFYLTAPNGTLLDSLGTVSLDGDVSYGSKPDGTNNFFYFATPTPGSTNNNQVGAVSLRADTVLFSAKGGYYPSGTLVYLSSPVATDKIYYTRDGSTPTSSSTLYSNPISVNADGIIKARIYRDGTLPGAVVTHTYWVTRNHKFPVSSITTNPDNLWNYYTGIYVMGPNAQSNTPNYGANFWQDWEKPAHFELFDAQQQKVIDQGVGIKIYGAYTRSYDLKSMAIFARNQYGKGSIKYKLFDDKGYDKFEALILRQSGNDYGYTQFRDGFMTGLTRKMDVDRQGFKPTAHYLNGVYWGILNLREKINEHFVASAHSFNTQEVSVLGSSVNSELEIMEGTDEDYRALLSYVSSSNLQTAANYNHLMNWIDIDNYIQYQLMQIYVSNTDWPGNNIKFWRMHSPESKWRWILYDTDFGFGLYNSTAYNHNTLAFATDATKTAWPNPAWSTLLFRRLLTSTQFRNNFINQYADHLNTTFLPTNVNPQIDSLKALFEPEIQFHINRRGSSYSNWSSQVERLKTYSNNRPSFAWNHIQSHFNLGSRWSINVNVSNANHGQVKLNSIILDQAAFSGTYFQNIPIDLKALPKPGYKFVRWDGTVPAITPDISYNMFAANPTFTAIFTQASEADIQIVINEFNFKSATHFDTDDWIELYNNGSATVDLSGWILTDLGKEEPYIFPAGTIMYPGDYLVICEKLKKFRNHRPATRNSRGNFAFGLNSTGDKIRLFNAANKLMDAVDYYTIKPWPVIQDETGGTLELVNPGVDNTLAKNWVVNSSLGTPGKQNLGYVQTNNEPDTFAPRFSMNCYPNPFKDYTTIELSIPASNTYRIDVLDMHGRIIKPLLNGNLTADTYYFDWDGTDLNNKIQRSGVYLIKCQSSTTNTTIKVLKIN